MTAIPSTGALGNASITNANFQIYIEDLRDFVAESVLGAGARYTLTISGGAIVPADGATSAGGVIIVETEGLAASDDLTTITTTNTHDGQLVILQPNNTARVTTVKHAAGGAGQISLIDSADFVLDALDKWLLVQRRGTDWVEFARGYGIDYPGLHSFNRIASVPMQNIICPHERLVIDYATVATITLTAATVVLSDSSGRYKRFNSMSETLTLSSTGANGRDVVDNAGAEQASSWYHLFAIGKTDGTLDTFASQVGYPGSGTSIYTRLPSGYTWAGYLGAAYNDSGLNLIEFHQRGIDVTRAQLTVASSVTNTSVTAVSGMSAALPVTARKARGTARITRTTTTGSAVFSIYSDSGGAMIVAQPRGENMTATASYQVPFEALLQTAQTLYYALNAASQNGDLFIGGWGY